MVLLASVLKGNGLERAILSRAARGLLEHGLREHFGVPCPEIIRLKSGKPVFSVENGLCFSISHSANAVCVGISECPIGVDIERLRHFDEGHARRLFSEAMLRDFGYFGGWTLRESVFKLCGSGSLMSMELFRRNGEIVEVGGAAFCRLYDNLPDFACAAAAEDPANLPERLELVSPDRFM